VDEKTFKFQSDEVLVARLKELQRQFDDESGKPEKIARQFVLIRAELRSRGMSEKNLEWAIAPPQA